MEFGELGCADSFEFAFEHRIQGGSLASPMTVRKYLVAKPSKSGLVVLSVFGLPFLGVGLFAAFSFLRAPNQPLPTRIGATVFASVLAIIGAGLIFGSFYGYSRQKKQADIELAQPDSPRLW
jgi:hypothetical protein